MALAGADVWSIHTSDVALGSRAKQSQMICVLRCEDRRSKPEWQ